MGALLIILKIAAVIIAVILALILLVLFTILFVPIKYGFNCEKYEEIKFNGFIKWLFGIIKIAFRYENDDFGYDIKIFGKTLGETKESEVFEENNKNDDTPKEPQAKEVTFKSDNINKEVIKTPVIASEIKKDTNKIVENKFEKIYAQTEERKQNTKKAVVRRVKIEDIPKKEDIKNENSYKKHNDEKEESKEVLNKEYFIKMPFSEKKELLGEVIKFTKKMLKGVLPKDININVKIGTDDPALTGYILAASGYIKGTVFSGINVMADFENSVFEGEGSIRGRIFIFYVFIQSIIFALKKPIRKIIKMYLKDRGVIK